MSTRDDQGHWAEYNEAQRERAVRPLCVEVLTLAGDGAGRTAVDLGCGLGRETRALLDAGWRVLAVDGQPQTRERVLATTRGAAQDRLTIDVTTFAGLVDLPPADLAHASFALPFAGPADFPRVWGLLRDRLRPGGWFAGNLFGVNDSWAGEPGMTFLARAEVEALLDGWDVVRFDEVDADGDAFSGPKHWHLFDVIARRPQVR